MRYWFPTLLSLQLALVCGCGDSVSDTESRERTGTLFAEAVTAADRGDREAARSLYEEILVRDPTNGTVHLNLAMLLQDAFKDYIGAVYHYQRYLTLQPQSEKRDLVLSRRDASKTLLATELASTIIDRRQQALMTERDALSAAVAENRQTETTLRAQITSLEENINALRKDNAELKKLIEALRMPALSDKEAPTPQTDSDTRREDLLAAREEALREKSSSDEPALASSDSIAAIRADAARMLNEPDGGQAAVNAITRKAAEGQQDDVSSLSVPTPGQKYLVRPGDTFSKLAREAYGSAGQWRRIRDANRSTTNPDGRLRAGELILIP